MNELRKRLKEVNRIFGTPTYVYKGGRIREKARTLRDAIPYFPTKVLYAMKANSNPEILKILKEEGVGVDAVSPGEVALGLRHDFFVLFTGNNVTDDEMDFVAEKGVMINIDSLSALERFGSRHCGKDVSIRINPDVGAGHHSHCITGGPESKFGIWHSQLDEALEIAKRNCLRIKGIHQHIGSQILETDKFLLAMDVLLKEAHRFPDLEFVNFGGGLGVPYNPEDRKLPVKRLGRMMSDKFLKFSHNYGKPVTMMIEPGRYLIADSGWLLVTVNTVKRNPDGRVFAGVDSGFNHLLRPAMYGSYHPIENVSNPKGKKEEVDIVGNICESGDRFAQERKISRVREGDVLAIGMAGAYGFSMSSHYNLRAKPAEVLMEKNYFSLIRKRESIYDVI